MPKNTFSLPEPSQFWDDDRLALEEYVDEAPSDTLIASVETELGYRLPETYLALMKQHNGGIPYATCYPLPNPQEGEQEYVEITGFLSIGRKSPTRCAAPPATNYLRKAGTIPTTACISAIVLPPALI